MLRLALFFLSNVLFCIMLRLVLFLKDLLTSVSMLFRCCFSTNHLTLSLGGLSVKVMLPSSGCMSALTAAMLRLFMLRL